LLRNIGVWVRASVRPRAGEVWEYQPNGAQMSVIDGKDDHRAGALPRRVVTALLRT
jgi:hypothetical protein